MFEGRAVILPSTARSTSFDDRARSLVASANGRPFNGWIEEREVADVDPKKGAKDPKKGGKHPRIGTTIKDKWRIDSLLGRGGMATVFAATHRNGNRVAIKMLHLDLARDVDVRARFLREGYVANRVNHPGSVRVLDDDVSEDGAAFLVMELLEGELLEKRRERLGGRLPLPEVFSVIDQLLDVLAAAHANGVIHRDVKPENIFVTHEGQVKVLDFGIARLRESSSTAHSVSYATSTGLVIGTLNFMSPEQATGGDVDARTDIWATGATMFHLLSGRMVHENVELHDYLVSASTLHAPSLALHAPDMPPEIVAVVDRALLIDRDKRWQDARSLRRALESAYEAVKSRIQRDEDELVPSTDGNTLHGAPAEALASAVPARPRGSGRSSKSLPKNPSSKSTSRFTDPGDARTRPAALALGIGAGALLGTIGVLALAFGMGAGRGPAPVASTEVSASASAAGAPDTAGDSGAAAAPNDGGSSATPAVAVLDASSEPSAALDATIGDVPPERPTIIFEDAAVRHHRRRDASAPTAPASDDAAAPTASPSATPLTTSSAAPATSASAPPAAATAVPPPAASVPDNPYD